MITTRMSPKQRSSINAAARAAGLSTNAFMIEAAARYAAEIMADPGGKGEQRTPDNDGIPGDAGS